MTRPLMITDVRYKRVGEGAQLHRQLKYLQFRDGSLREDEYRQGIERSPEDEPADDLDNAVYPRHNRRWVDRGMGGNYDTIRRQAEQLKGSRVLARSWVISPDSELMWHIPPEQRIAVMQRVAEATIERWYEQNGWGQPEYSYVVHDKQRTSDGAQMLHAHVITPGTLGVDAVEGTRVDHLIKRPHTRDLQRTSNDVLRQEMERALGRERTARIIAERDSIPDAHRKFQQQVASLTGDEQAAARLAGCPSPHHALGLKKAEQRIERIGRVYDALSLVRQMKKQRQRKEREAEQKRKRQRQMAELRMYARYRRDQNWRTRTEAQRARRSAARQARQQRYEAELKEARQADRERIEKYTQAARERRAALEPSAEQMQQVRQDRRAELDALVQEALRPDRGLTLAHDGGY